MNNESPRLLRAIFFCLPLAWWLAGCSKKPAVAPETNILQSSTPIPVTQPQDVKWTFEPDAITLNLYSNSNLNYYDGYRHSLTICIYQLSDQSKYKQIEQTQSGFEKMLECNEFDPSAVGYQRLFIQPDQNQSLILDRLEGARYLGIVAGYADLSPASASKVFQIPIAQSKKGRLWWRKTLYWAGKLTLNVYLDTQSIQRVEGVQDAQ